MIYIMILNLFARIEFDEKTPRAFLRFRGRWFQIWFWLNGWGLILELYNYLGVI